jgi:hypothetical protein
MVGAAPYTVIQAGPAGSLQKRKKADRGGASGKWVKLAENEEFTS